MSALKSPVPRRHGPPKFGDLDALKQAENATPIERMYLSFGKTPRKHCDSCKHHHGFLENSCNLYEWLMKEVNVIDWNSDACGKWERVL